jgi:type IV pilus assembly protein PilE
MITVAIVGILAAIAYPGYQKQVMSTRRADAKAALVELQNFMERWFTEHNTYLNAGAAPTLPPPSSGGQYYTFSLNAVAATTYTLQAVPVDGSPQANDICGTLTLSNTGARDHTAGTDAQCW